MLHAALIFAAQFSMVMLLGMQSLSVNAGHRGLAMGNSLLIGCAGYWLMASIAEAKTTGMFTLVWWAYILAGPCGILVSMLLHPRIASWYKAFGRK